MQVESQLLHCNFRQLQHILGTLLSVIYMEQDFFYIQIGRFGKMDFLRSLLQLMVSVVLTQVEYIFKSSI